MKNKTLSKGLFSMSTSYIKIHFTLQNGVEKQGSCSKCPTERSELNLGFGLSLAAYKDLQSREDTRNAVWQQEGWHEVVYYTGEQISLYFT